MRTRFTASLITSFFLACSLSAAKSTPADFSNANWIWFTFTSEIPLNFLPASVCYFRADCAVPARETIKHGEIVITCDNLFAVYLNGNSIGECEPDNSAWQHPKRYDVTEFLTEGTNVLAVEAVNTLPGPAGLIAELKVTFADGTTLSKVSDASWRCSDQERLRWEQPGFDDSRWDPATILRTYGAAPWGRVTAGPLEKGGAEVSKVSAAGKQVLAKQALSGWSGAVMEVDPADDFSWPEGIVFVGDDCSLYIASGPKRSAYDSLSVTIFNPRRSRTFPEHDLPAPMKVGHTLFVMRPAKPGVTPHLVLDAGEGAIGSPGVSFDGKKIFISMAKEGDAFFHIYSLNPDGTGLAQLTDGPFHDIDPAELPDGRIVFTSTRIGTFEEYHNPPSRSLFVMQPDGSGIHAITHTIIFDNEPEVLSDGRIIFIRSDNFFDRGKVETMLHAIHPDGRGGYTEFAIDNGPEYGGRLRSYLCGSPAPMPDGRLAFVSGPGITIGSPGAPSMKQNNFRMQAGDVAPLPDGRLLCTMGAQYTDEIGSGKQKRTVAGFDYRKIGVLDHERRPPEFTVIYEAQKEGIHSPVFLGPRKRPAVLPEKVDCSKPHTGSETGFLFCQNARFTKHSTAGWRHVRAIRVLAGKGLTMRSSHSYIVHAGSEVRDLGTVPLNPDGSFFVEVPANTPLALQAVDAEGRSELNEMSWIYLRPGERRSCIGCHHYRQAVPANTSTMSLAVQAPAVELLGRGTPHRFRGNNPAVTGLMELQFDRFREVAGLNRHEAGADPLITGKEEVNLLIGQLEGDTIGEKTSAAHRLAIFRDQRAASALAACLDDPCREVRLSCAMALAACGNRASAEPLLKALADDDEITAQAASVALENLTGHREPFDAFTPQVERKKQARAWRAWLETKTWDALEEDLVERLQSEDRDVVRRAAAALGHIGGDAAKKALHAYLERERSNNPLPEWRRSHRGDGARFNSLSAVNPRTVQAAARSLGYLKDTDAISLLKETALQHNNPDSGNLFLAEAVVEALGGIGTEQAHDALVEVFAALGDYPRYTYWYGDHEALMACHTSPVHYFIAEALDKTGATRAGSILPQLIESLPVDPDRALFAENDDYETLAGRIIRRHKADDAVIETCLSILGDGDAQPAGVFEKAIRRTHRCWGGHPRAENRAAQVLSLVCRNSEYEPRIRAAFQRYSRKETGIKRVFDTGIPVVLKLPVKNWVCFYLARALGYLADTKSLDVLLEALSGEYAEGASGHPDPLGPGVLFLHNGLTPCWRAAAAWALGCIGDRRAVDALFRATAEMKNATDTRHASAEALKRLVTSSDRRLLLKILKLAQTYPETSTQKVLFSIWERCR